MDISLKKQEVVFDTVICTFELLFDNSPFTEWSQSQIDRKESSLPVRAGLIFEMFPFCILFQVRLKFGARPFSHFAKNKKKKTRRDREVGVLRWCIYFITCTFAQNL